MRKRERENPCAICLHYHRCEEGEVCGVCGHRPAGIVERVAAQPPGGAFPSEILQGFVYLGGYDNACRGELLKTVGISRILNTIPACQNFYKNSFTYYCLEDYKTLPFDDAVQFLEQCEKDKARVLVHCMSGKSRSPAIVIAYLMKCRGWRLTQSLQWVKERRPLVELAEAVYQQLVDYEQKIFGSKQVQVCPPTGPIPSSAFGFHNPVDSATVPAFNQKASPIFGLHKPVDAATLPLFNQKTTPSTFNCTYPDVSSDEFIFRAGLMNEQRVVDTSTFGFNTVPGAEAPMDSC